MDGTNVAGRDRRDPRFFCNIEQPIAQPTELAAQVLTSMTRLHAHGDLSAREAREVTCCGDSPIQARAAYFEPISAINRVFDIEDTPNQSTGVGALVEIDTPLAVEEQNHGGPQRSAGAELDIDQLKSLAN
jgi:hypothetical protein